MGNSTSSSKTLEPTVEVLSAKKPPATLDDIRNTGTPDGDNWFEREPKSAYRWAKQEWRKGTTLRVICDTAGIPDRTLRRWIYEKTELDFEGKIIRGGWKAEQTALERVAQSKMLKARRKVIQGVLDKGLAVVDKGLDSYFDPDTGELSLKFIPPKELRYITQAMSDLSKIANASIVEEMESEEGEGTTIKLTAVQIIKKYQDAERFLDAPEDD